MLLLFDLNCCHGYFPQSFTHTQLGKKEALLDFIPEVDKLPKTSKLYLPGGLTLFKGVKCNPLPC